MELSETDVRCDSLRETWTLHHLTDTHIDDPDFACAELTARIQEIAADPKALWIGGGDYGSLIVPNDKRFSGSLPPAYRDAVARIPDRFLERAEEMFSPIAGKCIGIGVGNHEATIARNYHRGVGAELAMRLGRPELYLGDRGWALIQFRHASRHGVRTLRCYQYHGWSAGRLKGRKALQAERDLGAWDADVFFLGHDHQPDSSIWWTQEPYHDSRNNRWKLRLRPRAVINGGSWTYGQCAPMRDSEKRESKASEFPTQSWQEGKNFRPQAPVSPILLVTIDWGTPCEPRHRKKGRPTGFSFETRLHAGTNYLGDEYVREGG